MKTRLVPAILALLLAAAPPAWAETVAVVNGRIMTMSPEAGPAGEIASGAVLIRDGRIAAVGAGLDIPPGARVIDAEGALVTPGLVEAGSQLGLVEVRNGVDSADDRACEKPCAGAAFDIAAGLNPDSTLLPAARLGGVTRAVTIPSPAGESVFAGQAAAIHLGDGMDILAAPRIALLADYGEAGAARLGGSRGAAMGALAAAFAEARAGEDDDADPERLVLRRALDGEIPLIVAVSSAADILDVLALGKEFSLRIVLLGAEEGWRVAGEIARAEAGVILDPTHNRPNAFETIGSTLDNARLLHEAGVEIAIHGNGPHRAREMRYNAGNAVANGLPWRAALTAITAGPARMFGLDDRFGVLEAGREADLVIWSGDPLEPLTTPRAVFIRGEEQPLVSRGLKLRDRYLSADGDYPPAYQ